MSNYQPSNNGYNVQKKDQTFMKISLSPTMVFVVVFTMAISTAYSDPATSASKKNSYRKQFESTQIGLTATGAGGCNSTICHGGATPVPGEVFLGNEWDRWYNHGKGAHFRAYKVLYEDQRSDRMVKILFGSKAIAKETPQCLACHALVVPPNLRGRAFDIEDGVSCEACHGRSEKWLSLHTNKVAWRQQMTKEQRTELGFYDTRDLVHRAEKCLECHLGTETKKVDHKMMAAGHPALTLELSVDLIDIPKHWRNEQSYLSENEGGGFQARTWAVGQVVVFRESLYRLIDWAKSDAPPDYAFFECYACHHDLKVPSWRHRIEYIPRNAPGEPVLDVAGWAMCKSIASMLMSQEHDTYTKQIDDLIRAMSLRNPDRRVVSEAAGKLVHLMEQLSRKTAITSFDRTNVLQLMRNIVTDSKETALLGYQGGSQIFLAMDALYIGALLNLGEKPQNHEEIYVILATMHDMLYDADEKETPGHYDPFVLIALAQDFFQLLANP